MTDYNPRGKLWANDENSIGHKILSKMGWRKGKGLGRHENGNIDPIKVWKKKNPTGFGWEEKQPVGESNFEYDQLLQNLNKKSRPNSEHVASSAKVASSLALMSQKSRSRIHYQKIVKGKDICSYSERDMKSIFFKVRPAEKLGLEKIKQEPECDRNAQQNTFKSNMSSKDYFTMKLKSKKGSSVFIQKVINDHKKNGLTNDFTHQTEKSKEVFENNMCEISIKQEPEDSHLSTNDTKCFRDGTLDAKLDGDLVSKLNEKRKKSKHKYDPAAKFANGNSENGIKNEDEGFHLPKKEKIKEWSKFLNEIETKCFQEETICEELDSGIVSKLNKKRKRSKREYDCDNIHIIDPAADLTNGHDDQTEKSEPTDHLIPENEVEMKMSKKKGKRHMQEETENLHSSSEFGEKPKKLKRFIPLEEFNTDDQIAPACSNTSTLKEERKKKKKLAVNLENLEKIEGSDNQIDMNGVIDNPDPENANPASKCKSKKRKRDSVIDDSNDFHVEKLKSKKQKKNKLKDKKFQFDFEVSEANGDCSLSEMEPQSYDATTDKTVSEKIKTFASKRINQLKSCIKTSKHFLNNAKQRVSFKEVIEIKNISPRKAKGDLFDESESNILEDTEILNSRNDNEKPIETEDDYVPCLDIPRSASFDCWIESQRKACKLKSYRDMVEEIRKDETLKTTNWLDIKGYGNWGF